MDWTQESRQSLIDGEKIVEKRIPEGFFGHEKRNPKTGLVPAPVGRIPKCTEMAIISEQIFAFTSIVHYIWTTHLRNGHLLYLRRILSPIADKTVLVVYATFGDAVGQPCVSKMCISQITNNLTKRNPK